MPRLQRQHRRRRRPAGGARRIAAYRRGLPATGRGIEGAGLRRLRAARAARTGRATRTSCSSAPATDARRCVDGAAARGIYLRDRSSEPGCEGCIRITTGIVEHTRAGLAVHGGGAMRRARNRSPDDGNADCAGARRSTARAGTTSAPASGSSTTCSSSSRGTAGSTSTSRRRAISTSISITRSRISASRSAKPCRRRSATAAASTAPATS